MLRWLPHLSPSSACTILQQISPPLQRQFEALHGRQAGGNVKAQRWTFMNNGKAAAVREGTVSAVLSAECMAYRLLLTDIHAGEKEESSGGLCG
jgi:hypothetical protein